ncbi:MAG: AbrB/MazE/SpoVT family DNA-binding domain-containing protein [Thermoanaerobacterales bacterium]|nr:AbrB/MazE/SpoVT family DNA-binding domain-containing protein [Bacillota bacterium]MDI6906408.1 AbrB/MazE/SpoVT family DNA-binding domain-containing protein [Thermoanaerobacterales bacterium]
MAIVKLSSKRQLTLPAKLCRELGLQAGDRLVIERKGDQITFTRLPKDFAGFLKGSARGAYGRTPGEIDEYVRKERETWD